MHGTRGSAWRHATTSAPPDATTATAHKRSSRPSGWRPSSSTGCTPSNPTPSSARSSPMRSAPRPSSRTEPPLEAADTARAPPRPLRPRRLHQAQIHHAPPDPRGRATTPRTTSRPDLDRAQELLGDFARFWHAEPSPAEQRKLLSTIFDHIWQDNGTIVAVKPRPAFAGYFKALDQAKSKHPKADRKRGVTKAGATRVKPSFVTPQIEIRL
jgi:hypothetical protein